MADTRRVRLGVVSSHLVHPEDCPDDDCVVEVISLGVSNNARSLVRCLFTRDKSRVSTTSIRPLGG